MERMKKPCLLGVTLLLFLLLVSAAHGARLADAKDVAAAAGDHRERVTVRTGHGHGYSSHSGGHSNGGTPEQGGGAGVVDPRNNSARNPHRNAAASRALGYSSWLICTLLVAAASMIY